VVTVGARPWMKIVVLHEDGRTEVLKIAGEWLAVDGTHLNRLRHAGLSISLPRMVYTMAGVVL